MPHTTNSLDSRKVSPWISPVDPEFLDSIVQCFINLFVYVVGICMLDFTAQWPPPIEVDSDVQSHRIYMYESRSAITDQARVAPSADSQDNMCFILEDCTSGLPTLQDHYRKTPRSLLKKEVRLNGYMAGFTTQWKWLTDVVPEDCIIYLIGGVILLSFAVPNSIKCRQIRSEQVESSHVEVNTRSTFEQRPSCLLALVRSDDE
ncbi:hypothetical protein Tco_1156060 [Tanacetum coccineum]